MVEVFRTNVDTEETATFILELIAGQLGILNANFDLEDCDRIFRVAYCPREKIPEIIELFRSQGYLIEILPD
ncbi:hypothetical protein [Cecembia rubra]|uniref:Signal transducing protein n=1 Tax=Cecembia rubra TaxID=1485585 RepID=A0A2P8ECG8_9BACT|nr:hypothetical protein [Cecembia rubra]PSL07165.1 hypothetical protein CLV48_10194 [Cecembia rubra]